MAPGRANRNSDSFIMNESSFVNSFTTILFTGKASDFGDWSGLLLDHRRYSQHQLALVSSGVLTNGVYDIKLILDTKTELEASADTGKTLTITGASSVITQFTGIFKGLHLVASTGFTAGQTISAVLTSTNGALVNS